MQPTKKIYPYITKYYKSFKFGLYYSRKLPKTIITPTFKLFNYSNDKYECFFDDPISDFLHISSPTLPSHISIHYLQNHIELSSEYNNKYPIPQHIIFRIHDILFQHGFDTFQLGDNSQDIILPNLPPNINLNNLFEIYKYAVPPFNKIKINNLDWRHHNGLYTDPYYNTARQFIENNYKFLAFKTYPSSKPEGGLRLSFNCEIYNLLNNENYKLSTCEENGMLRGYSPYSNSVSMERHLIKTGFIPFWVLNYFVNSLHQTDIKWELIT